MNRQTKRMMQRQGQMGADGGPAAPQRPPQAQPRPAPRGPRQSPIEFIGEVRSELRRVAWPTRAEVVNYSTIVLLTLVLLVGLIFVLDLAFSKAVFFLFDT